jgi:hypothetical protein
MILSESIEKMPEIADKLKFFFHFITQIVRFITVLFT